MLLSQYGITLEPLTLNHLELVRNWRNSPLVNEFMEFKEQISEEQQLHWFTSLDTKTAHYFVIKSESKPIGVIHLNAINFETKQAEVGLFIGEPQFIGTGITFGASLLLLNLAFKHFKLEKVIAKINNAHTNAIRYNQFIGFKRLTYGTSDFSMWELSLENYSNNKLKLENYLR
jgi:UDP-4-amino-4,6-dideoxy-N-acetyl-beta-L-altrosamine N-acetyltransferase